MHLNRSIRYIVVCIFFCGSGLLFTGKVVRAQNSQKLIPIQGNVTDSITGEAIPGAAIAEAGSGKIIYSGTNGSYQMELHPGIRKLSCSFAGYKSFFITIHLISDKTIDFGLSPVSGTLQEVTIQSRVSDKQLNSLQTGTIQLSRKEVSGLPLFLGESDFFKALQLMPGVQVSGEGNAAIYVRGGGYDQNLILLDQATVYNPTHLLGFYSVFNTDIINEVTLIKSGIPAEYGNRISSVLDFTSKRSIPDRIQTNGTIGLISSKINVDIPFMNQRGAFFIAARKTYLNSLLDLFRKVGLIGNHSVLSKTGYDFFDINASIALAVSKKDRLFLSTYKGADWLVLNSKAIDLHINMNWGNQLASLSWNHQFNPECYMDNYIIYSGYRMKMYLIQSQYNLNMHSSIDDIGYKSRITRIINNHKLRAGLAIIKHNIVPNSSRATSDSTSLDLGSVNHYNSYEGSVYLSDEIKLSEKLGFMGGLRFNTFYQVGEFTDYTRNTLGEISDTIHYKTGALIKKYQSPEFRFSARYIISTTTSVKFSFNTNNQYVHLVNASSVTFPTDFWISSSRLVKPQKGKQWAVGFYKNFFSFETSVELYYKTFQNQMEFSNGIFNSVKSSLLDENLIFGKGRAYGVEFLIRKPVGKFNGWIGYTLSRTEKSFADIENGLWIPAKYDRPHDVSIVTNYTFSPKWSFSAVFVFASGSTYTPVIGRYFIANNVVNQYGTYNSARMPAYHRLDISATRVLKKTERFNSSLTFSILNVYNRHNPFFIYPETSGDISKYTMKVVPKEVSIFPILPSVSWQFSF